MKHKKAVIITSILLVFILFILPFTASVIVYNSFFGKRYSTNAPFKYNVSEFDGLYRDRYEFTSDRNQNLVGYLYYSVNHTDIPKGVIVFGHGMGGGGHTSYMDCVYYFTQNGYYVFAFDATGNDESEGDGIKGIPQQVIDLDRAISYVENSIPETAGLPVMLFGHSWGGYSVANVLSFHPEVKAVVCISGFNRSSDLIEAQGKQLVGNTAVILMPYVKLYERIIFGDTAGNTALDGFEASDARVMIIHSADDDIVPIEYGYDIFYEKYNSSDRFEFIRYEDKGHSEIYYSYEAIEAINKLSEEMSEWRNSLPYVYDDPQNADRYKTDSEAYLNALDRSVICNLIDYDLFSYIVDFYDQALNV